MGLEQKFLATVLNVLYKGGLNPFNKCVGEWHLMAPKYYEMILDILTNDSDVGSATKTIQTILDSAVRRKRPTNTTLLLFCHNNIAKIINNNTSNFGAKSGLIVAISKNLSHQKPFRDACDALLSCKNANFLSDQGKQELQQILATRTQSRSNATSETATTQNKPLADLHQAIIEAQSAALSIKNKSYKTRYLNSIGTIEESLNKLDTNSRQNLDAFISETQSRINDLKQGASRHEKILYVLTNILIALTGMGLLLLAGKAIHSYYRYNKRILLFNHPFARVDRQTQSIERAISTFGGSHSPLVATR